jgi:hypothetical protein
MFSCRILLLSAVAGLACCSISGQSVVSVRSGVVHFFEGSVSIDGQPLEQKFGRFYDIKQGSELRTDQGRAEVLLTPGVFLRVDENSSIRMLANRLTDTRVEFIGGTVSVDSSNADAGAPVTVMYKGYEVRFKKPGLYRFNSAPADLRVESGEAEVAFNNRSTAVTAAQMLPFATPLVARSMDQSGDDALDRWTKERSDSIAAGNASAAASDDLTSALNNPQGNTYDFGAYPVTTNGVLVPGGMWSPYSLYPGSLYRYNYVPVYRQGVIGYGYRPLAPIRIGTYAPIGAFQPRPRTVPPTLPGYRPPMSPGAGSHPAAGNARHR